MNGRRQPSQLCSATATGYWQFNNATRWLNRNTNLQLLRRNAGSIHHQQFDELLIEAKGMT
jgi:hypothetical protein